MSLASPHPATIEAEQLLKDCDVIRQRRSGPGGQHRNKVETAIRLTHRPTGVTSEASERRSQAANQTMSVRRLRLNLALEVRTAIDAAPTPLWRSRCRGGVISINVDHDDFPSLLAEALDVLSAADWHLTPAAEHLTCSSSQLLKLLRKESRAFTLLNTHRKAAGLPPLR